MLLVTSALSGWFNHGVNYRTASNNRSPIYCQNKHNEKHHRRTGSTEARPSLLLQSSVYRSPTQSTVEDFINNSSEKLASFLQFLFCHSFL